MAANGEDAVAGLRQRPPQLENTSVDNGIGSTNSTRRTLHKKYTRPLDQLPGASSEYFFALSGSGERYIRRSISGPFVGYLPISFASSGSRPRRRNIEFLY